MLVLTALGYKNSVPTSKSSYKIYLGYVFLFNHWTKNVLNTWNEMQQLKELEQFNHVYKKHKEKQTNWKQVKTKQ
jgi:hypothetical protein